MRKLVAILVSCSLICLGAYRWGDMKWSTVKVEGMEIFYSEIMQLMSPTAYCYEKRRADLILMDMGRFFLPHMWTFYAKNGKSLEQKEEKKEYVNEVEVTEKEEKEDALQEENEMSAIANTEEIQESVITSSDTVGLKKEVEINRVKLQDFDYLRQNFYQIDNTTTIGSDQLDVVQLLGKKFTLQMVGEGPKILIYHTHSQERYKDTETGSGSVVDVGDYLEQLLEANYGIEVLHHKGQYDMPSRDNAYSNALPEIERVLMENPTIEVVIDLHRDGVPESRHFVTEINGKPTAQIMFFNGLSRTTSQGELTYLPNPYVADNLAFSFQMQLTAAEYYPGLTRKIYLKGYRYNLHLKPMSLLVEVGAQTNTFEEAINAMEPLADILALVLTANSSE